MNNVDLLKKHSRICGMRYSEWNQLWDELKADSEILSILKKLVKVGVDIDINEDYSCALLGYYLADTFVLVTSCYKHYEPEKFDMMLKIKNWLEK